MANAMTSCQVPFCSIKYKKTLVANRNGIVRQKTFKYPVYPMPKERLLRKEWLNTIRESLQAIKLKYGSLQQDMQVCMLHFEKDNFERFNPRGKPIGANEFALKPDTVPTLFCRNKKCTDEACHMHNQERIDSILAITPEEVQAAKIRFKELEKSRKANMEKEIKETKLALKMKKKSKKALAKKKLTGRKIVTNSKESSVKDAPLISKDVVHSHLDHSYFLVEKPKPVRFNVDPQVVDNPNSSRVNLDPQSMEKPKPLRFSLDPQDMKKQENIPDALDTKDSETKKSPTKPSLADIRTGFYFDGFDDPKVKEHFKTLEQENKKLKCMLDGIHSLFNADQLQRVGIQPYYLSGPKLPWSEETVAECLRIKYACGNHGYKYLMKKGYPFPSFTTLDDQISSLKVKPEVLSECTQIMKERANTEWKQDEENRKPVTKKEDADFEEKCE